MRQLLEPITTEFQLADMLAEPNGPLWSDEEMVTKLQDRLQESYEAYQSTIADVERIMKKIASKLDLERAAEVGQSLASLATSSLLCILAQA
jgi:excinuclease UvrABC helicase subunit UvrB